MIHPVELSATCFPAARSFAARTCVAILLLSLGVLSGGKIWSQGFAPSEAVGKMTVAAGLQVKLFASEPEVRQPIFVKCDDRGRLWTIQYLQYPNPAGLKRTQVDRWSRTTYDRVPPRRPMAHAVPTRSRFSKTKMETAGLTKSKILWTV